MKNNQPIGVFDSGLGGLTVVRAIQQKLSNESIIYFGDTARVPYGSKSKESIIKFTYEAVKFFLSHDVKCIVIACNTASALALKEVSASVNIPIIGVINPGAEAAIAASKSNKIGVIGTAATIASEAYAQAIKKLKNDVIVYSQPCPLFVPLVEEDWCDRAATNLIVQEYLLPLKTAKIDTLVLGCTHYPLLSEAIGKFMGSEVQLVDSAGTCAESLKKQLEQTKNFADADIPKNETYFVSDSAARFSELGTRFLGHRLQAIKITIE